MAPRTVPDAATRPLPGSAGVALVLALLLTGCAPQADRSARGSDATAAPPGSGERFRLPSPTLAGRDFPAFSATATGREVAVHEAPDGPRRTVLASPLESGAPLTLLLVQRRGEWLEVLLPVKPNGSTGWVRARSVRLQGVAYRLDVRTAAHELDLYDRGELVDTFPIGIGKASTPTPGGTFFLKELLQPPDPGGTYGPYAYGLSGFSTTLESFMGTDAVIGLHGTDDPASIGRDASSGCIRLRNADITRLATMLPLGTPVRILA